MSGIDQQTSCSNPSRCFFCAMSEPNPSRRRSKLINFFKEMPLRDDQEHVLALNGLWNIAMKHPNDPEFPSLGVFECLGRLIQRAVSDKRWLLHDQNIYIPYYAAHVIGSYTMNKAEFADMAAKSGVVLPLMELLRGKITWVEKRVAVRALGHMASHDTSFEAIAALHEREIVELAMEVASTCVEEVYEEFACVKEFKRLNYHCNLLTRGLGVLETENRKAEEWASQLQCWSLYLLNCFACRERSLSLICDKEFLKKVCKMWGGLTNPKSPAGIGLIRTLCKTESGRQSLADLEEVIEAICNVSRSSDDYQMMGIDCLLLLLKDPESRYKVIDIAVLFLGDLVELGSREGRPKVGQRITQALLQDYHKIKYGKMRLRSEKAEKMLGEIWDLKVDRKRREKLLCEHEIRERKLSAAKLKKQGNLYFWSGDMEKAVMKYSKALDLCPLKRRKERIVLHSNRVQCHLLLRDPESAISDATRALCLSSEVSPHGKSLWRRSQAYDMKGLARESLMDCLMFVEGRIKSDKTKRGRIPYYAGRMMNKQMNATWIFASAARLRSHNKGEDDKVRETNGRDEVDNMVIKINGLPSESVNMEKPWRRRKLEMVGRSGKEFRRHHQIGSSAHMKKGKNLESSINAVRHNIGVGL